ncbi:MAG: hypothetical protein IPP35_05330 [Elusimicrobia bacterium]|nr:hypothetical protein [Elusimicrobiota bacterium]
MTLTVDSSSWEENGNRSDLRRKTARAARHENHAAVHPRPAVLTVISSSARRYVPRSGLRETPHWTNVRRGAYYAPQLLPPIPTFPAPVHGKSRAAFLAAPRCAPADRSR